ncbi:hypothetical protein [Suttonella indologenes]|nr:hypothetical protein [Suttonella indologenes]
MSHVGKPPAKPRHTRQPINSKNSITMANVNSNANQVGMWQVGMWGTVGV